MGNDYAELVNSVEAAAILGVRPGTIRSYVQRGMLVPAVPVPGRHMFRRADVETLAESRRRQPNGRRKHD